MQLTDDDKLQFVNALNAKMLENTALQQQANSDAEPQFQNSPDLRTALMDAIIDSGDAQRSMSTQAINSDKLRGALLDILLGPGQLYHALKARASPSPPWLAEENTGRQSLPSWFHARNQQQRI